MSELISVFLFLFIAIILAVWLAHVMMVRDEGIDYGWASYDRFKKEFNKVDWRYEEDFKRSLFGHEERLTFTNRDMYHAGVIKFNYKGMIMYDPISYFMSGLYVRSYIKKNGLRRKKYKMKRNKIKEWR